MAMKGNLNFLWILLLPSQLLGQNYTDYKPKYIEHNNRYILDKIEYQSNRTVFHFRYLSKPSYESSMSFYGPLHKYQWSLENVYNPSEYYKMTELKNVKKNGILLYAIFNQDELLFATKPYDVFTCEVHFPKLPSHITLANFLEGVNNKESPTHFNCLQVKIKVRNDKELGNEEDMVKRIKNFEIMEYGFVRSTLPAVQKVTTQNTTQIKKTEVKKEEVKLLPKVVVLSEAQAQSGEIDFIKK